MARALGTHEVQTGWKGPRQGVTVISNTGENGESPNRLEVLTELEQAFHAIGSPTDAKERIRRWKGYAPFAVEFLLERARTLVNADALSEVSHILAASGYAIEHVLAALRTAQESSPDYIEALLRALAWSNARTSLPEVELLQTLKPYLSHPDVDVRERAVETVAEVLPMELAHTVLGEALEQETDEGACQAIRDILSDLP